MSFFSKFTKGAAKVQNKNILEAIAKVLRLNADAFIGE